MAGAQSVGTSSSASDKRVRGAGSFREELDKLLMLASQQFEEQQSSTMEITFPHTHFVAPKSEEEILQMHQNGVPLNTGQDTAYCLRLWDAWAASRNVNTELIDKIPPLLQITTEKLQFWITRFVLETRKKDGTEYPPNSLYHIVTGLMCYLHVNGRPSTDFFKDAEFASFRQTLDTEMKRLKSTGLGSKPKQAEPLSEEDEEKLWQAKVLGEHSPQALLNTMIYINGVYFALRSGTEHGQLRHKPCQIQVMDAEGDKGVP